MFTFVARSRNVRPVPCFGSELDLCDLCGTLPELARLQSVVDFGLGYGAQIHRKQSIL
jgi:hypothetical protein